ncbi:Glutamate decarboxylase 1 [Carex littledalei]|uniref:glutamate decarboxylase n=1 Tax=Carex littledalei TaxID=544730 RepID=A0A833VF85_9POAL|nr:Glutamate decarboxylase 1 [Carex littledalei]
MLATNSAEKSGISSSTEPDTSTEPDQGVLNRCVNMIAHLFNAPIEVGTVGLSEAIILAGLAFKRIWQSKRKVEGKPYDKPNIVTD